MSSFVEEPLAPAPFGEQEQEHGGQRHDRLPVMAQSIGGHQSSVDDDDDDDISASQKMLSAVSGSLFTSLLVTPLDVVRVRLQSQPTPSTRNAPRYFPAVVSSLTPSARFASISSLGGTSCCREVFWATNNVPFCFASPSVGSMAALSAPSHTTSISAASCAVDETRRKAFTSTFDGLRKIAQNEGASSLWRGLSPTLVMAIPANVIYFTGYDTLRYSPRSPVRAYVPDGCAPLMAGSLARVAAAVVVSPIEMFRTRMQAASGSGEGLFRETLVGVRDMVNAKGYASLWRGLTLTMWRDVPFSGIYWWGYEAVRNRLTDLRDARRGRSVGSAAAGRTRSRSRSRSREDHTSTFVDSFVAGAASGAVASILTMPFDVGKTRQQVSTRPAGGAGRGPLPEERSMPRFLYHIFREEGVPGLFRGWAARCLKVAPACAIMISSYEIGKRMARTSNENSRGRERGRLS